MIRSYEALFDISFRSRKEIRISPQAWFQAANGLCLAEFKQCLPGQMEDKFSPIFRSLRLAARHDTAPARNCVLIGKRNFSKSWGSRASDCFPFASPPLLLPLLHSSFVAILPTFSMNSRGNACYPG